jgi:anti-sigma B factor antagonist
MDARDDAGHGAGGHVDLKLGHHATDGIEVIEVQGEIDMYTAPRLRELLIDLVSRGSYQLVVNLDKVGFLDSTGLGVLVGGLKRVRAHDGSLDLVCTQQRDPEDLEDHRADGGLWHLRDGGPGHRGREGPPVRNASPGPPSATSTPLS